MTFFDPWIVAALLALAPQEPQAPAGAQASQDARAVESSWIDAAARGGNLKVGWSELDGLLVDRHAMGEEGRDALRHLLKARVLDRLAAESRFEVGTSEVNARWAELDSEIRASGEGPGLDAYLAEEGVDQAVFREFLRLAIVQETLARQALGIPREREINGEQQEMWLDQVMAQRGTQLPAPPWTDGVAARCGDLAVSATDFIEFLRTQLPPDRVQEACYQLLLEKRVLERMPDLSEAALAAAVTAEIDRRRADVANDPKYKGLPYEQILAAQGQRIEALARDPALVCAALANEWVERTYGEDGLRTTYQTERATFDGRFGEAREVRALFLRASVFENPLNPRTFEAAEVQIAQFAGQVNAYEDFLRLVSEHSEDPSSRDVQGLLGWVPRGEERIPAPIREATWGEDGRSFGSARMVGPVRLTAGVALLWIGTRRPAPDWELMRIEVHRELRRRFLDECLPRDAVMTFLDG